MNEGGLGSFGLGNPLQADATAGTQLEPDFDHLNAAKLVFFAHSSALENGSHGGVVDERIRENLRFKRRLQLIKHRLLGRIGRVYAISF
jgi:hypothetical protein